MKICCLASGSAGNMTYIESEKTRILVDLGLGIREAEARLLAIGVDPYSIDAIFVTHEHVDHIGGIKAFVRKYHTKVCAHEMEYNALLEKTVVPQDLRLKFNDNDFLFNDIRVKNYRLSHDAFCCVGYTFISGGHKISIATDTGVVPSYAIDGMAGSDIIVLESNHDVQMLLDNEKYTSYLKKRILSSRGHLSNEECAAVIYKLLTKAPTFQFILAHLSEKNNTPMKCFESVTKNLAKVGIKEGEDVYIDIALQNRPTRMFEIFDEE